MILSLMQVVFVFAPLVMLNTAALLTSSHSPDLNTTEVKDSRISISTLSARPIVGESPGPDDPFIFSDDQGWTVLNGSYS